MVIQNFFAVKAIKAVDRLVFRLAIPWAIEYGICYVLGVIVSDTLLHGRLDQPLAAFGLLAIGTFYRYFNVSQHGHQAGPQFMSMPAVQLDPEVLANLLNSNGHDGAADAAADKLSGPYL